LLVWLWTGLKHCCNSCHARYLPEALLLLLLCIARSRCLLLLLLLLW
jgi:hypothetical protein